MREFELEYTEGRAELGRESTQDWGYPSGKDRYMIRATRTADGRLVTMLFCNGVAIAPPAGDGAPWNGAAGLPLVHEAGIPLPACAFAYDALDPREWQREPDSHWFRGL